MVRLKGTPATRFRSPERQSVRRTPPVIADSTCGRCEGSRQGQLAVRASRLPTCGCCVGVGACLGLCSERPFREQRAVLLLAE